MPNPDTTTPWDRGRLAFWNGRELYANPHLEQQAAEWRKGWQTADADYNARGGVEPRTAAALARLRPWDLKPLTPHTTGTQRSAGQASADGWRKTIAPSHTQKRSS